MVRKVDSQSQVLWSELTVIFLLTYLHIYTRDDDELWVWEMQNFHFSEIRKWSKPAEIDSRELVRGVRCKVCTGL